jgi:DNA polymerase-3 subunit alpha
VFSEAYQRYRDSLVKDRLVVVEGSVSVDEYSGGYRMSTERILDIDTARAAYAKRLEIDIAATRLQNDASALLAEILKPFREGGCPVWINYSGVAARARVALGQEWRVRPTDELLHRLTEMTGPDGVRLVY